jgi:hypothetical protein
MTVYPPGIISQAKTVCNVLWIMNLRLELSFIVLIQGGLHILPAFCPDYACCFDIGIYIDKTCGPGYHIGVFVLFQTGR